MAQWSAKTIHENINHPTQFQTGRTHDYVELKLARVPSVDRTEVERFPPIHGLIFNINEFCQLVEIHLMQISGSFCSNQYAEGMGMEIEILHIIGQLVIHGVAIERGSEPCASGKPEECAISRAIAVSVVLPLEETPY
jgi:hypothetical protein